MNLIYYKVGISSFLLYAPLFFSSSNIYNTMGNLRVILVVILLSPIYLFIRNTVLNNTTDDRALLRIINTVKDKRYSSLLFIFLIIYCLFQISSNIDVIFSDIVMNNMYLLQFSFQAITLIGVFVLLGSFYFMFKYESVRQNGFYRLTRVIMLLVAIILVIPVFSTLTISPVDITRVRGEAKIMELILPLLMFVTNWIILTLLFEDDMGGHKIKLSIRLFYYAIMLVFVREIFSIIYIYMYHSQNLTSLICY